MVKVETAHEMLAAVQAALPADIAICAAAVADWRAADEAPHKLKKQHQGTETELKLALNPDILATIAKPGPKRPRLVIGFAAETENLIENATAKRRARARTGSSPTTSGPGPASWAATTRKSISSPRRRRGLAADEQGRDGGAAARPRRRRARGLRSAAE